MKKNQILQGRDEGLSPLGGEPEPQLEIGDLRLLVAVADLGTLALAAERLHVTSSALSHRLRSLEARAGGSLFQRTGRGLVATPAGERLTSVARELVRRLAEVEREVAAIAGGHSGPLRLSTACYTSYRWIPKVLRAFRRQRPEIEVRVVPEHTRRPLEALRRGELELAVVMAPVRGADLEVRELFEDEVAILVAPDHRWAGRREVEPRELASETLLGYSAVPTESLVVNEVLLPAGVLPRQMVGVALTEAVVELVRAGEGVACLARWAVEEALAEGSLVALSFAGGGLRRTWRAVYPRGSGLEPAIVELCDLLAGSPVVLAGFAE